MSLQLILHSQLAQWAYLAGEGVSTFLSTLPRLFFPPKLSISERRQRCSKPGVGLLPTLAITALASGYPADQRCTYNHYHDLRLQFPGQYTTILEQEQVTFF